MKRARRLLITGLYGLLLTWGCGSAESDSQSPAACVPPAEPASGWNFGHPALDPADAARAAALIGSCLPDDGAARYLAAYYYERDSGERWRLDVVDCLAGKTNGCAAVTQCLGASADLTGPCEPRCAGSIFERCDDTLHFRIDCAKQGRRCDADQGCVACDAGPACDYSSYVDHCDGDRPIRCLDGMETTLSPCALWGLTCVDDAATLGSAYCAGAEGSCTVDHHGSPELAGVACTADGLQVCVNGGLHHIDCAEVGAGFTCQTLGSTAFCGLAAECDPTPSTVADATCDGDSLTFCNAGRIDKLDCKQLGFTGCNATWGVCSPSPW
ncbi:MAG: hypothetical protein H6717_33515 [Polyangiaceae bacterium]|nr:hypothetical protein [Polyangiaceae bacterium]